MRYLREIDSSMKIFNCKNCNKEIRRYNIGAGFCSQSCSNSMRKISEETKNKISIGNSKEKIIIKCLTCNNNFKVRPHLKNQKYCSLKCVYLSEEYRNKHKNKKGLFKCGKNHWNWKGGITPINFCIRISNEMKEWKFQILKRDNFKCVECGNKNNLEVDHIKPFAYYPELRFNINNGRTLCKECHKKTDTYLSKVFKYEF